MDLFGMNKRKEKQLEIQAMLVAKTIQAMAEGGKKDVLLESLLTGRVIGSTIEGLSNNYTTYESQVDELYKKYNNDSDWGCAQTRATIDMRSAFIAGQGIAVTCDNNNTAKWIEKYLTKNRMFGDRFINFVKGTEMAGQTILFNKPGTLYSGELFIRIAKKPYRSTYPHNYMPEAKEYDLERTRAYIQKNANAEKIYLSNSAYVYVVTGGDDVLSYGPTPKLGTVLNDLENYDRALKDMRRLNHILARITPTFKTSSSTETKALTEWVADQKWKIGKSYIGSADFKYEVPTSGAHENLKMEMVSTLKNISAVSGMPVHWLGYVDLMSNRATADSLYEFINNATLNERAIWEDKIYELIVKAQEMYINSGGKELGKFDPEFQVKIPLLDFSNFLERIRALNIAYGDEAISLGDYRSSIPGINPLKTKKAVEKEKKEALKNVVYTRPNVGMEPKKNGDEKENNEE